MLAIGENLGSHGSDVLEVLTASITRAMMEAASTSETLANFYRATRCKIPEDTQSSSFVQFLNF
jgi:hypothetical protein